MTEALIRDAAVFAGLVVLFETCERRLPLQSVDRRADLRTDVLSFAAALLLNRVAVWMLQSAESGLALHAAPGWLAPLHALSPVSKIVTGMLLVDFAIYWIHRAQHAHPTLWRTHVWHHSARELYWLSGFRTSLLHSFLNNVPQVLVPSVILGAGPVEIAAGHAIGLFVQFWEHSNTRLRIGPLRHVFVTPAYHRVHHEAALVAPRNLGNIFTIWDRLFGTYLSPEGRQPPRVLGLRRSPPGIRIPRLLVGI